VLRECARKRITQRRPPDIQRYAAFAQILANPSGGRVFLMHNDEDGQRHRVQLTEAPATRLENYPVCAA
jgi:hypothetical protein